MTDAGASSEITKPPASKFLGLPKSKLGRVGMWLAVAFVVLFALNSAFVGLFGMNPNTPAWTQLVMPWYGFVVLGVGAASGVVGLIAIIRDRERSWISWLTLLPLAFVVFMLVGEFAVPH